jgi:hypothetical protein
MSWIKATVYDPFSHPKVWGQSGQFREQLHRTHLVRCLEY